MSLVDPSGRAIATVAPEAAPQEQPDLQALVEQIRRHHVRVEIPASLMIENGGETPQVLLADIRKTIAREIRDELDWSIEINPVTGSRHMTCQICVAPAHVADALVAIVESTREKS